MFQKGGSSTSGLKPNNFRVNEKAKKKNINKTRDLEDANVLCVVVQMEWSTME